MTKLVLHTPESGKNLSNHYKRAFSQGIELFVVTAYLTDWDTSLKLTPACRHFRMIVGRDFGITRKIACSKVMAWLPPKRKAEFLVADRIVGFHPKAVFWREKDRSCYALVGSSNLTLAAFNSNYEANALVQLDERGTSVQNGG
ncbi:phospholipase D-like protein [Edaphobacter modestus]|uniref:Phospholipase D-like protein n=1 Tax=Edaphobacter modestus TaxID=388466 RepID=A0A4Q7YM24_9BACT|nr:phospholipase D-like protein [Edaphobacter modestus]